MKINTYTYFITNYVDNIKYRTDEGKIKLSKADGYKHNIRVCEICCKLIQETNTKFICQPRLKCGSRPDIIFFRGEEIFIVEVRNTEKDKRSKEKINKLPKELRQLIIYVEANKPLEEELVKIK